MGDGPENGIVIVGGGLAAVRTAEELRRAGYSGPLTIVSDETHLPYNRPPLSKEFLRGEVDEPTLEPRAFYGQLRITLRLGFCARRVDTDARTVTLADRAMLGYDQLVIATGLVPRRIPGLPDPAGIRVLRSLDDSIALRREASVAQRAVVVGAGFIGCEVAASLRGMALDVVLVEPLSTPLASALGERIGALVARMHRGKGVDVRTGTGVVKVRGDTVLLTDGAEVSADVVVAGVGARPATDWLAGSGIEVDPVDGGIVCDATGHTSAPNVWAVGDVAFWRDYAGSQARVEHWSSVVTQTRLLAPTMLGRDVPSGVVVPYFWSDQYDVKIQCLGVPRATDTVHLVEDDGRRFLAFYERDGVLAGVVGADMRSEVMGARSKIATRASISEVLA